MDALALAFPTLIAVTIPLGLGKPTLPDPISLARAEPIPSHHRASVNAARLEGILGFAGESRAPKNRALPERSPKPIIVPLAVPAENASRGKERRFRYLGRAVGEGGETFFFFDSDAGRVRAIKERCALDGIGLSRDGEGDFLLMEGGVSWRVSRE